MDGTVSSPTDSTHKLGMFNALCALKYLISVRLSLVDSATCIKTTFKAASHDARLYTCQQDAAVHSGHVKKSKLSHTFPL
jgi:hypothetical protein